MRFCDVELFNCLIVWVCGYANEFLSDSNLDLVSACSMYLLDIRIMLYMECAFPEINSVWNEILWVPIYCFTM